MLRSIRGFFLVLLSWAAFAGTGDSEGASVYRIKNIERIAPVFAGLPMRGQFREHEGYCFVAFYDPDRQLTLGKRKVDETAWEFAKLDEFVAFDAHNHVVFDFDRDGYLHVAANMHGTPLNYWRSTRPMDIMNMERLDRMTGVNEDRATYPGFFHDPSGALVFQYRAGMSGQGMRLLNIYDEGTHSWKRMEGKGEKKDAPLLDGSPECNAYPTGPYRGPDGLYHLSWSWRDLFLFRTTHDVGYARSKDMKTWTDSRGHRVSLPITPENYECAVPIPIMSGYRGPGIGFDSQRRVILSYTGFDRDGNTQGFAARLEQGHWRYYQVTDWAQRFDMNGGGSLYFPYNYGSLHPKSEGLLALRVMNEPMFGDGADYEYTVDEKTLRIVGGPVRIYPKELETPPPSTVPLEARLVGPPERMLRWFTLPAGRDGDAEYASQAPKDIWLELVELEKNPDLTPPPYVPSVDRDATWNMVMGCVDLARAPELAKADALYTAGDFTEAYRTFRAYWHRRVKEVLADPDITPRWEEWPAPPSARIISDYKKHRYEFAGLRRTLPYDVEFWWPFQPGVLERWNGLSHTTNATTAIGPDELNQVSTLARWFNDFNRLRHLTGLGTSYADTHDSETARYWAHDFYDWLYDNPVPDAAQETGPWGFDVTADRFCDALMPGLYQFVDSESMRDEEFFGLVRSIVDHTRYLTTAIVTTGASSFERQEAAEMLHWWASVFSEFSYSPELARNAMDVMVSFGR